MWADTHVIISGTTVTIPRLCGASIISLLLGSMSLLGWSEFVGAIRDEMKKLDHLFIMSEIFPDSCAIAGELKRNSVHVRDNVLEIVIVMNHIRVIIWWMIINCALKRNNMAKVVESTNKRLKAVCDMSSTAALSLTIEDESIAELHAMREHIRPLLHLLVRPLFSGGIIANTPIMKYAQLMFSGYEMSSFLVIHAWLNSSVKTAAHVDAQVLEEMVAYKNMYDSVKAACGDHPIECYKLLHPDAEHIKSDGIKRLRYCAIKW